MPTFRQIGTLCLDDWGVVFVQFACVENKLCSIFDGIAFNVIHEFLYLWHGDMEIFELGDGRVVDGPSNAHGDGDNGGGDPSMLLDCFQQGSIFGVFHMDGFLCVMIVTIICKFNNKNVVLR